MSDGLRRAANRYPNKTALTYYYADGRMVSYSYKELNKKVNRLENALIDFGVKKGDKIVAMSHNSPQLVFFDICAPKNRSMVRPYKFCS